MIFPQTSGPFQSKVFENIKLENGQALCMSHQEDLNSVYLNRKLFGSYDNIAACSKCTRPTNTNANLLADFRAYSENQCCVISPNLSKKPSQFASTIKNPPLNFGEHVLEHVLWDCNSIGYELGSLVYMKDQKILAACSKNGSVCFWSIRDTIKLIEPKLKLEKKINFAKYCMISDSKKYLVISTDKGVHVYNITEEGSCMILLGVIDEEKMVSDLDFLKEKGKIMTVCNESTAKIWNLNTLELEKIVDLQKYDIKGKIHTVMSLERSGKVAIEHDKGLSIIRDLQDEESVDVRHHRVPDKKDFGCKYLQNSKRFILNNGQYIDILGEEGFEEVRRYNMQQSSLVRETIAKKFIASEDESLFISHGEFSQLNSHWEGHLVRHSLQMFIWGISDIELMEDQFQIAVAHAHKGTVTILRINANINIERGEGLPLLPAVSSTEEKLSAIQNSTGGLNSGDGGTNLFSGKSSGSGGLFSGSNSSGGGSLFSGGGGLFSGKPSGGSLFSGSGGSGNVSGFGFLSGGGSGGGSLFSGKPSGGSLFPGGGSNGGLLLRTLRNPPSGRNKTDLLSSNSSKKTTKPKPKPKEALKPAKKGKKIQKVQIRSAAMKRKENSVQSVKKEGKKATKVKPVKKQKKSETNKNMIEAVRIKGKKKTKEEKVWVVLPSADDEKKRGRSLSKKSKVSKAKDLSKDKGSRSRSKSKSVTRKK